MCSCSCCRRSDAKIIWYDIIRYQNTATTVGATKNGAEDPKTWNKLQKKTFIERGKLRLRKRGCRNFSSLSKDLTHHHSSPTAPVKNANLHLFNLYPCNASTHMATHPAREPRQNDVHKNWTTTRGRGGQCAIPDLNSTVRTRPLLKGRSLTDTRT